MLPAVLGALVVITSGIARIFKFQENWLQYRTLVENLDREEVLYRAAVAEYATIEPAMRDRFFVERVENIWPARPRNTSLRTAPRVRQIPNQPTRQPIAESPPVNNPAASFKDKLARTGPRKLLALDGGGIRGVITLEILAEIEKTLQAKLGRGDDFVLADYSIISQARALARSSAPASR